MRTNSRSLFILVTKGHSIDFIRVVFIFNLRLMRLMQFSYNAGCIVTIMSNFSWLSKNS